MLFQNKKKRISILNQNGQREVMLTNLPLLIKPWMRSINRSTPPLLCDAGGMTAIAFKTFGEQKQLLLRTHARKSARWEKKRRNHTTNYYVHETNYDR
jgi:hypothetical protein